MSIRRWISQAWDKFLEFLPPEAILYWYSFLHHIHNGIHLIRYWFGGRIIYVILLAIGTGLLYVLQALRTVLTVQPIDTTIFFDLHRINWNLILTWEELEKIFGVYIIILIIYGLWKSRSFLVIEEFSDDTSSDEKNKITGLKSLLIAELNRINQLYLDVDEQRPIATSAGECQQVSAMLMVDDTGDLLAKTEIIGAKFSLGSIEMPVGLFISLFNSISRGPRIRGSIRKEKEDYILLATLSGAHQNISWKVIGKKLPEDEEEPTISEHYQDNTTSHSIDRIVHELACRIFTDIPSTGSSRWEATHLFNEGLRKYRECLRTPMDQVKNLEKAEQNFQNALLYDNKFTSAWYNLGVVYSELNLKTAAEKAFQRAIEQEPNQPKAYYALAQTKYRLSQLSLAVQPSRNYEYQIQIFSHCQQVCDLCHSDGLPLKRIKYWLHGWTFISPSSLMAQNLNLVGLTHLKNAEYLFKKETKDQRKKETEDRIKKENKHAIKYYQKAVVAAWRWYSSISSYGTDRDYFQKKKWRDACRNLANTIGDLGWAYVLDAPYSNNPERSRDYAEWLLNCALTLNNELKSECTCPELHWKLGVACLYKNNPKGACDAFQAAIRINPKVMKYYISQIIARAFQEDKSQIAESCCMKDALQYTVQSFKNEREQKDDQWGSLDLLSKLIEASSSTIESKNKNNPLFQCFETLKKFVELNYDVSQKLDFYDEKFCKNADRIIHEMKDTVKQNDQSYRASYSPECCIYWNILIKWMWGHIRFAEGRRNFYKAKNKPETHYDKIELLLYTAEKNFRAAIHHFKDFPGECPQVYSRIGLVKTSRKSHNCSSALSCLTIAHEINPTGDYEHVVQGMLAITLQDYNKAIKYFKEALRRAYDLSTYSQYILSNIFKDLAYSHIKLAEKSGDDRKQKEFYYKEALHFLDQAQEILISGYNKALQPDQDLLNLKNDPQNILLHKASQYLRSIIATRYWSAEINRDNENYPDAIYNYHIVNSFYKPKGCQNSNLIIRGMTTIEKWPGFEEYLITLLQLGKTHYKSQKYDCAQQFFDKILEYESLIKSSNNERFFGRNIWDRIHPYDLLILAYLNKIRLCVDLNLIDKEIPNWLNQINKLNNDLEGVKDAAQKKIYQDVEMNNHLERIIRSEKAELEKHRGLVALQFNYPDVMNNTSQLTNDLKPSFSSIKVAIKSFKKAIALDPKPETYVFLLKAIEKWIELLKNNVTEKPIPKELAVAAEKGKKEKTEKSTSILKATIILKTIERSIELLKNNETEKSISKDLPEEEKDMKTERSEIATCVQKATIILEALKKLDADGENKEFIDTFSKKIQKWSNSPEENSKKDCNESAPVVCCVVPCPPDNKTKSDT